MSKASKFLAIVALSVCIVYSGVAEAWELPVVGRVTDAFREPDHEFGPGNRGIEYTTQVGSNVRASDAGFVAFAGQVAGVLYVVIDHGEQIKSTYGNLDNIFVRVGDRLNAGDVVGLAGIRTHFGIRVNGRYVDPQKFIGKPRLIPVDRVD